MKPTRPLPESHYAGRNNIWGVAFGEWDGLLGAELSSKFLLSDDDWRSLHEDEGGPLSYDPDETHQLYANVIQAVIPDGERITYRIFADPRFFWQPDNRFVHLEYDKLGLVEGFNRYGVWPDSEPDYIFAGGKSIEHEVEVLQFYAGLMDRYLGAYRRKPFETREQRREALAYVIRHYDPLIWALDGFLHIATFEYSRANLKQVIAAEAARFGLELPLYDFEIRSFSME